MKKYKESVIDEILVEMIEAGSSAVCSEIHKIFITFRIRKNNLKRRNKLLCPFIRKFMLLLLLLIMIMIIQIAVIIEVYDLISCIQYFIQVNI